MKQMVINFYPDKELAQELVGAYKNANELIIKAGNLPELRNYIISTLDLFQNYDNELAGVAMDSLEKLRDLINPNISGPIVSLTESNIVESPICNTYLLCILYLKIASDPRYIYLQNCILSEKLELDKLSANELNRECLDILDFYTEA